MMMVAAFVPGPFARQINHRNTVSLSSSNDDENGPGMDGAAAELTSTLVRLDQQWRQQRQLTRRSPKTGPVWQMLELEPPQEEEPDRTEEGGTATVPKKKDFVYLMEPDTMPSCVILFLGGAVLGQYPHIAYSEFLSRISQRMGAAVIAAPYNVDLNHFDVSKRTAQQLRQALIQCQDSRNYPESMPVFSLGHSLGSKLHTIALAATGLGREWNGVGLLSFNNFGFAGSIQMAKTFGQELNGNNKDDASSSGIPSGFDFNALLDFAEQAVGFLGVEFSPNPSDTQRMIELKFDEELQSKTRLFVFDDDELDSGKEFLDRAPGATVSGLPGNHLTPVFLKFGLDDLDLDESAREVASQFANGYQGGSFGSEPDMDRVVTEVCNWIKGQPPTRGSQNKQWGTATPQSENAYSSRRISGTIVDAETE
eukprot:CAMPEP_0198284710 /NCGR_PEP_ID=MMETSP1449-20131203/4161_1 /TAXON_ID=420275 /ORGANISM="Attheya septentrionalis, Strain CCMP2084" /LENGTH=423 /DNA_ID=CAMNT_0043981915 /DNA_START=189 /DNA_END=1460 /DNA_ORIENTATION=+